LRLGEAWSPSTPDSPSVVGYFDLLMLTKDGTLATLTLGREQKKVLLILSYDRINETPLRHNPDSTDLLRQFASLGCTPCLITKNNQTHDYEQLQPKAVN
jgi:hypothetical protein